ncbi:U-box domain-containing protein [Striga asiatica]|uniref:U-box domain-containing protein n=1 Tax=Striga asiatica TaxID=4170 RepID=A0A5A7QXG0_STRAF|nr:U-box domain-containing protein [Striga asiatica]
MEEFESSPISSGSPYSSSTHTEALTEFSIFIDKLDPIMSQMTDITDSPAVQKAIDSLQADYIRAKALVNSQSSQSPPTKHIEHLVQNLGRSLGLVFFAGREVPLKNREKIEALCKEMMNVRFEFDEIEYETEEKTQVLTTVISQVKGGDGEAFKNAVLRLSEFVLDATVSDQTLVHEDVIRILTSRLGSCRGGQERVIIVKTLRYLLLQDNGHKENMKDLEFLSTLVKLLTRDVEERREAVGLLLSLSDENGVMRQIGRIKGCILMLVAIANGDDEEASRDAKMLLRNMSGNTQHALHMAEAAYFKPLINYLKEGAIEPLVQMFQRGSLEAKLSALNALQSLSDSSHNTKHLIDSNILVPLLQLLFSVTSVQMTLREPASAILAKIAKSESILVNKIDVAHQMLSLLNVSTPAIQQNLLEALYNIVSHSGAVKVRRKMKENGAIKLLLQFFKERDVRIRTGALKLVHVLSKDILIQELDYANVSVVANIASTSGSEIEMAEALGILSNLPMSDKKVTEILKKEKLVPLMVSKMSSIQINSTLTSTTVCLAESIAGLMLRFTDPNDKSLQHFVAENGIIDVLIKSLSCSSESIIISKVALCLAQMSRNTLHLSNSRKAKWFCMQPTMDASCEVHKGFCSVKGTFCLVKAQAVGPLVGILVGSERGADEAVLSCLSTLLVDEIWESGSRFLEKMSGVCAVIKVLRCGSFKARERALWILERVFRVEDYRIEYGKCAQVVLIDLAQNGDAMLAPAVAKVLAQLELLQEQSTYF